jgi:hypothetical protein
MAQILLKDQMVLMDLEDLLKDQMVLMDLEDLDPIQNLLEL